MSPSPASDHSSAAAPDVSVVSVSKWWLYLIRTQKNTLYTGITTNVENRFAEHTQGKKGSKYLRARGPLTLVYQVCIGSRSLASKTEHRIKRLKKVQKEKIVETSPSRSELLSLLALEDPSDQLLYH